MSVTPPMQYTPRESGQALPDDAFLQRGRQLTFIILGGMLGADFLAILAVVVLMGGVGAFSGIIRLAIASGLAYATWRGNDVAKWILVVLGFIGGLLSVFAGFGLLFFSPVLGLTSLLVAGAHIAGGVMLLVSGPVKAYLQYQRNTML